MKKLSEKIDSKVNNVQFVMEDKEEIVVGHAVDVKYTKEVKETDVMVIDTGCPKSLVGRVWLEKYLEKNGIEKEDLKTKSGSEKFRFGPSAIYKSEEIVNLPIVIKEKGTEDGLVKLFMDVFVVNAENVPLLFGQNTMKEWKFVLDIG